MKPCPTPRRSAWRFVLAALPPLLALSPAPALARTVIGSVNTNFRWLGPDDKVVVERYDDPRVPNAACYVSRAETGGVKGWVGLATDPSRFSIACRAVGPITVPAIKPGRPSLGWRTRRAAAALNTRSIRSAARGLSDRMKATI